jgi:hypothetical protein
MSLGPEPTRGVGAWSRAQLWNAAEQAKERKDARTVREWEIVFRSELCDGERRELAVRFARGLGLAEPCLLWAIS